MNRFFGVLVGLFLAFPAIAQEVPVVPTSAAAPLPSYMDGVNISGMEYSPGKVNGVNGTDFYVPSSAEFSYFKGKNFSIIRLPLDEARIQPVPNGPLNQNNLALITSVIEIARTMGLYIILDIHTYGKMWDPASQSYQPIGTPGSIITNQVFANLWQRLATVYRNYPNVIYGLMNEPNIQSPAQWHASAIAAINAIRGISKTQIISIPGTYFTTAATWPTNGNASVWTGYKDPVGGPFFFEMHQYLDSNYSGNSSTCVSGSGSNDLTGATNWLSTNGYKALLGEFDWYNSCNSANTVSAQCVTEGNNLLHALSSSAWAGWTWWGSGGGAGDNCVNLLPGSDGFAGDQAQTPQLVAAFPSGTGIVNGSFETPSISGIVYNPSGATWIFTNNAGFQANGSAFGAPAPPNGKQTAFLQCGTNPYCAASGGVEPLITEAFTATAGSHTVSFSAALRTSYNTAPTPMSFNVMIDGTLVGSFKPTSGSWTTYTTKSITLTAGNHIISFVGTGVGPDTTDFIDSVILN
jgi:endoglucanase